MIVIALISTSGGAGRTSLSIAVARRLALLGREVTLIQADPANNIEYQLGYSSTSEIGLCQLVLQGTADLPKALKNTEAGFRLLPYGQSTTAQQLAISNRLTDTPDLITHLLNHNAFAAQGIVIVDLPRWPSEWCTRFLALSDLNLVTLVPDSTSILGIDPLLPHLLESRGASYFLMNRFDSAKVLHLDLWTLCKIKLSHRLLPFYLHDEQALPESQAAGMALEAHAPQSQLVDDLHKLSNWIDSEIG